MELTALIGKIAIASFLKNSKVHKFAKAMISLGESGGWLISFENTIQARITF